MADRRESVLLLVLDTLRYDAIFGSADNIPAPRLRRRAENALVYSRAYAPASWTLPSLASLFTGALPSNHGAVSTARCLDPSLETLAETFSGKGFQSSLFACNIYLTSPFGLTRGFEEVFHFGPAFSSGDFGHNWLSFVRTEGGAEDKRQLFKRLLFESLEFLEQKLTPHGLHSESRDQGGAEACTAVARWLANRPKSVPFFTVVNLMEAHLPFPKGFAPEGVADGLLEVVNPNRWHYLLGLESFDKLEKLRKWYLAGVRYEDQLTDRLLSDLDSSGSLGNTWVIITSDHGDTFGENGSVGHGTFLTEELLHVPLVIIPPDGSGSTIDVPVSLIDLHNALRRLATDPTSALHIGGSPAIVAEDFGIPRFARLARNHLFQSLQRLPIASGLVKRALTLTITRRVVLADGYRLDFEDERPLHLQSFGDQGLGDMSPDTAPSAVRRLKELLDEELRTKKGRRIDRLNAIGRRQFHPEVLPISTRVRIAEEVVADAIRQFRNPAILWTGGKDSTLVLWIVRKVCLQLGKELPPAIFIDHGLHFAEVFEFMRHVQSAWDVKVLVARNDEFLARAEKPGGPVQMGSLGRENQEVLRHIGFAGDSIRWDLSTIEGNHLLKTFPMNQLVRQHSFDALFTGIRRDEDEARAGESFFSPRRNPHHVRIHPILMFDERAVWNVTLHNRLPICALYARGYRSFDAEFDTTKTGDGPAWEQDLDATPERAGRGQDKEGIMRRLRELGYM